MRTKALALLFLTLLSAVPAAHGEEFVFKFNSYTFTGGPTVQASGVFTGTWLSGNEWQITAVQGSMDGQPLVLGGSTDQGVPDFLFYTGRGSGGYGYGFPFDLNGVSLSNGALDILLACGSISYTQPDCEMLAPYPYDTSGLNFTYSQVPEPAMLELLVGGLLALGMCGRRPRQGPIGAMFARCAPDA